MLHASILLLLCSGALAGVTIQMPYQNPAGVTYSTSPVTYHQAYSPLVAQYGAPQYGAPAVPVASPAFTAAARYSPALLPSVAQPLSLARSYPIASAYPVARTLPIAPALPLTRAHYAQPAIPIARVATPLLAQPAPLLRQTLYTPQVDVPVAKIHAHPGVIQKVVDVAKPQVATQKYQVRRPAIQKEFYDVEERIIVRPAGRAVVELDGPVSKTPSGPTVVHPGHLYPVHGLPVLPSPGIVPQQPQNPPQQLPEQPQPLPTQQPQPLPPQQPQPQPDGQFDDSDSVAVDNPEVRSQEQPRARNQAQERPQEQANNNINNEQQAQEGLEASSRSGEQPLQRSQAEAQPQPQLGQPSPLQRSQLLGQLQPLQRTQLQPLGPLLPSPRTLSNEQAEENTARLLELLTARGAVEISKSADVRGRILSAGPNSNGEVPKEQVSTRRIVVNRPIQTVQEIEVAQPYTKIERVAVHQPTFFKTASVGLARVPAALPYTYYH